MLTVHTDLGDIDYALDRAELYRSQKIMNPALGLSGIDKCIEAIIDAKTSLFRAEQIYAMDYIQSQGFKRPESVRILDAHGDSGYNPKFYEYEDFNADGSSFNKSVVDWVNAYDGQCDALFIKPCNPAGISVSAKWSFIIFPIGDYHNLFGINGNSVMISVPISEHSKLIQTNNKYSTNNYIYQV